MVQDGKLLLNTSEAEASLVFLLLLLLWLGLNSSTQVYLVLGSPVSSVSFGRLQEAREEQRTASYHGHCSQLCFRGRQHLQIFLLFNLLLFVCWFVCLFLGYDCV